MSIVPEAVEYHIANIPTSLLMTWFVWLILFVISFITIRSNRTIPKPLQNISELLLSFVYQFADNAIGRESYRYYPLFVGIFMFILASNLIGLIPGFMSPTSDPHVTVGLALVSFVYYNIQGFRKHGLKYLRHFFGPPLPWYLSPINVLMFVIEIISNLARPFSLAIRLFCNIFAKEVFLGLLALLIVTFITGPDFLTKSLTIAPLLLRPAIILLGVMVGFIQAMIFLVLSIAYVSGAVQSEEHH